MKHQNDEKSYKDPICGMEVSRLTAVAEAEYQGKVYYFCAETCREAFKAEPIKYIPVIGNGGKSRRRPWHQLFP